MPAARPVLYAISFSESIFFPIPVDVALAPVVASQPARWISITLWCTIHSVLGALVAYALAMLFWDVAVQPWLSAGAIAHAEEISAQLASEGFILVLASAFTPIPYKLCALGAGLAALPLAPFVLASVIGRGARYAIVSYIAVRYREEASRLLRRYAEPIGLALIVALLAYLILIYV